MDYEKEYKRKALKPIVNYIESVMASYSKEELEERIKKALPKMESEDERIRKHIIKILDNLTPCYWDGNEKARCIAYLEKQKEQKPVISNDAIREGVAHFGITQYQIDNWLKKHINVVEQKPAEIDEYEIIKKHITGDSLSSEVNKRLKECGWYVTYEKPAEWSEMDKLHQHNIIAYLEFRKDKNLPEDTKYPVLDAWIAWLKSLRPQSHWKPSEVQTEAELEKAARYVYESWMGGTMDDVCRDVAELGKALNARKEE